MTDEGARSPGSAGGPEAGPDGSDPVGSLGEEAAKLFGAVSAWAREQGQETGQDAGREAGQDAGQDAGRGSGKRGAAQAAGAARRIDAHLATDDPECRWCPVCRTIHLVRACTPEVRDQLAVAAAHLMQAAAGLLVAASAPDRRDRPPGDQVQHIDLDDGPEASDEPDGPDRPVGPDGPGNSGGTP